MDPPLEQTPLDVLRALGHEMRTPLNAIALGLEVLRRAPAGAEQAQPIEAIGRQLEVLSRLAEDLFCAARLPSWKERLLITRVDLNDAARVSLETCRGLIGERCHRVVAVYHPDALPVEGDATRLGQIAVNLIDNAVKYTPRYGRIFLKSAREGSHAVLSIRDNGIGIAPDKLKRVFDPFVQIGDPRAQRRGIGLGLALVKRWVALHGGTIKAHSDGVDLGSEFVVRFPLLEEPRAEVAAHGSILTEEQGGYAFG
jgi:signal transduction histidine kinase